jgi:hypothetical protein
MTATKRTNRRLWIGSSLSLTMPSRYWKCRKCTARNERSTPTLRRCGSCGAPRPKKSSSRRLKPEDTYDYYCQVNADIHGITDESCGVCGKPRTFERKHDRDHDHLTGNPRGLACGGDAGCNVLMVRWITARVARSIATTKRVAGEPDAERWCMIADYLERVSAFYARERVESV